ncbi:MAG TPA: type II toxin-antitoxin system death-on-curing family toxin [Chthonomonadaceae bacterium]|nr:type II toxin-antitoxin system death-on-curing family toxin [Chthonomonadaceae bacterium]
MEYLTTHDLVWINNIITGATQPYNYVTLEAAMAGQYSYIQSQDVPEQAANLLGRLLFRTPFQNGNLRTAFIATLTFLNANGYATTVSDAEAARIFLEAALGRTSPRATVDAIAAPADKALPPTVTLRKLIAYECNLHQEALKLLASGEVNTVAAA